MNILFLYSQILFVLLFITRYNSDITFRVIKSSILHFAPMIKLHHIVSLSDNPEYYVYTLDFTPINQSHASTLLKMIVTNIPGEVRLRRIETNIENTDMILQKWNNMNNVDTYESKKLTKSVYNEINNIEIKNIIYTSLSWLPYMNLYKHNCQHFSNYVIDKIRNTQNQNYQNQNYQNQN